MFAPGFVNCKKGAVASDKVYQLLAHGWWFSPDTPASSTTKTGRHDIAEIFLKVALKHQIKKKIKTNYYLLIGHFFERRFQTRRFRKRAIFYLPGAT